MPEPSPAPVPSPATVPAIVTRTSTINLVRSSNLWTNANSAAGFVLRYLVTVRRQLIAVLESDSLADECLKVLIAHLVSNGFGELKQGRLRDYLIRAIRSAAKNRANELPPNERPRMAIDSLTNDHEPWLHHWRTGLLERAWRSLERIEHQQPENPLFSILHCATTKTKRSGQPLRERIKTERELDIDEARIQKLLPIARTTFAQLLADEVAETLEKPAEADVKAELKTLGLTRAFDGISISSEV